MNKKSKKTTFGRLGVIRSNPENKDNKIESNLFLFDQKIKNNVKYYPYFQDSYPCFQTTNFILVFKDNKKF
jgi:hypothetical protein